MCGASTRISACAWAAVTPGFSRPIIAIVLPQRLVSGLSGNGKYRSKRLPGAKIVAKSNDAGSTPTTVCGASLMTSAVPTIFGSRLKRRSQSGVAQHHRFRSVPRALFSGERPAQQRLHAEDVEEVVRDGHAGQPLGLAARRSGGCRRRHRTRSTRQPPTVSGSSLAGPACSQPASSGPTGRPASLLAIHTSSDGFSNGSGRRSSVLTTLKTVALAPMPSPAMRMAKTAKPASRRKVRKV